jgi:hypothetical protein
LPEGVGSEQVLVGVADDGDAVGDGLQGPAQAWSGDGPVRRTAALAARGWDAIGGSGEVEEVGTFGLVQLKRRGERLQHAGGGAGDLAALEAAGA